MPERVSIPSVTVREANAFSEIEIFEAAIRYSRYEFEMTTQRVLVLPLKREVLRDS